MKRLIRAVGALSFSMIVTYAAAQQTVVMGSSCEGAGDKLLHHARIRLRVHHVRIYSGIGKEALLDGDICRPAVC